MSRKSPFFENDDLKLIRHQISESFGRKLNSLADCVELSRMVYSTTGKMISYNTLRRFLGLVEDGKHQPNSSTISTLKAFVDSNNKCLNDVSFSSLLFSDFLRNKRNFESILDYGLNENIPEALAFLRMALISDSYTKEKKIFYSLFDNMDFFEKVPLYQLYQFMLSYSLILNQFSETSRLQIIKYISSNWDTGKHYINYYPDADNVFEMVNKRLPLFLDNGDVEFRSYMELFSWYSVLTSRLEKIKNLTSLDHIEYDENWHPVLKGRYYACQLGYALTKNNNLDFDNWLKRLINEAKRLKSYERNLILAYPLEILYEYKHVESIDIIIFELTSIDELNQYSSRNQIWLYEVSRLVEKGDKLNAALFFNKIDPLKFPNYEFSFLNGIYQNLKFKLVIID